MDKTSGTGERTVPTRPRGIRKGAASDVAEAVTSPDAMDFVASWHEVVRAIQRARGRASQAPGNGLSVAQYQIMAPLLDGPLPMFEVAVAAGVAGPTATRAVSNLVEMGYLDRRTSVHDGRQVTVSLTRLGRRTLTRKRGEIDAGNQFLAAGLTQQQQRDGAVILRKISQLLDQR